jgi:hypothetical protein
VDAVQCRGSLRIFNGIARRAATGACLAGRVPLPCLVLASLILLPRRSLTPGKSEISRFYRGNQRLK